MGFIEGLKQINEATQNSGGSSEDRVKARWLSLKDGDSVKLVFLQELDRGAINFSEKNGLGKVFLEHSNPDNWRKSAQCTKDEGSCYGCDRGWKVKKTLYINVLVDDGKEDPYVAVFSRGTGKGSVAKLLFEFAVDDETITDKYFKFKREGKTKDDTTYLLMPSKAHELNVEDYELFDLTKVVFYVSPERQEAYYLDGQEATAEPVPAGVGAAAAGPNVIW